MSNGDYELQKCSGMDGQENQLEDETNVDSGEEVEDGEGVGGSHGVWRMEKVLVAVMEC